MGGRRARKLSVQAWLTSTASGAAAVAAVVVVGLGVVVTGPVCVVEVAVLSVWATECCLRWTQDGEKDVGRVVARAVLRNGKYQC